MDPVVAMLPSNSCSVMGLGIGLSSVVSGMIAGSMKLSLAPESRRARIGVAEMSGIDRSRKKALAGQVART